MKLGHKINYFMPELLARELWHSMHILENASPHVLLKAEAKIKASDPCGHFELHVHFGPWVWLGNRLINISFCFCFLFVGLRF